MSLLLYIKSSYSLNIFPYFQISEAKITITEPRPEATETAIIISGTPEQTHAAQSLIQAFVLSETGSLDSGKS